MNKWTIRNSKANIDDMTKFLKISKTFATVLANRNILTKRSVKTYLKPDIYDLHDIFLMKNANIAFDILNNAIKNKLNIIVYGDYDVDGVTSTVILYKALKNLGANVDFYIPNREEEGYGLNFFAIDELKQKNINLILTCDNGIASIDEVNYIKQNKMNIIILDHHEPRFEERNNQKFDLLPNADAIIDPKQKDCNYPFKFLCAAGISFKFMLQFYKILNKDFDLHDELLVFASIATICDIVDLVDENRIISKVGIDILNNNKNINMGLFQIIRLKGLEFKDIDEHSYGFVIGPCINASGRLESAIKAVELFLCNDEKKAIKLASELCVLNEERKNLTTNAVEKVIMNIENSTIKNDKVIVVYDETIHESIAGIVAGRIKEIYYRPTLIITKSSDFAKGSARSILGYNIFEELLKLKHLFIKFGGHPMAAGFSLLKENVCILRSLLNQNCIMQKKDMVEHISIDKAIFFNEINLELAEELKLMKPVGKENKSAIFATKSVIINKVDFLGKDKKILKFVLEDEKKTTIDAISFNGFQKFEDLLIKNIELEELEKIFNGFKKSIDLKFDVVYSIEVNMYNNLQNVQLIIKDFRLS